MNRKYAIDANILIGPSRGLYSFDIAPGFWNELVEKGCDKIILVDKIRDEIYRNEDQLSWWLKSTESSFIVKDSGVKNIISSYRKIMVSVQSNKQYKESAKAQFASSADSWLCDCYARKI